MTQTLPVAFYLNDVDGDSPRRGFPQASRASDVEARIEESHTRGVLEGRAAAQVENDAVIARQIASADQKLKSERQRWVSEEGGRLADLIDRSLGDLEQRMAQHVARILKPILSEEVRLKAVSQLSDALHDMLTKGDYAVISISGPGDLLDAVRARLKVDPDKLVFTETSGVDLAIRADETVLETRIGAWSDAIRGDAA